MRDGLEMEKTILIVEDDQGHADLIRKMLVRSGIKAPVRHLADGQEALDFFFDPGPETSPDKVAKGFVVLLDIRMPKVNGIEVLDCLKASSITRDVPVVMVTTTDDPTEMDKCFALGCRDYVQKPVDDAKLLGIIKELLEVS